MTGAISNVVYAVNSGMAEGGTALLWLFHHIRRGAKLSMLQPTRTIFRR